MDIQVDAEGKKAIEKLCDLALKGHGLEAFNLIVKIVASMSILVDNVFQDENKDKKGTS